MENEVYRVKTVNAAANSKSTTWVKATSRLQAKFYVEDMYTRAVVQSCLVRTPPTDVKIYDAR